MSVRIVTDSASDLPPEVAEEHKIAVVPLYINFGAQSFLDGVELERDEFYARLPSSRPPPTTSAPGAAAFLETYQRVIAEGASAILSIHIASSLSNVCNAAQLAASSVTGVPVRVFDGGQITLGTGFLAVHAAEKAAAGAGLGEIITSLEAMAMRTYSFAALDSLDTLRRSGRVNLVQYGIGTVLQVKPILKMHGGQIVPDRARTGNGAIGRLIDLALRLGPLESIALVHAHAPERLQQPRRTLEARLPAAPIRMVSEVAPVIGAHVGTGAVGLVCTEAASPLN
jgi:DegV family protein with EDD domain